MKRRSTRYFVEFSKRWQWLVATASPSPVLDGSGLDETSRTRIAFALGAFGRTNMIQELTPAGVLFLAGASKGRCDLCSPLDLARLMPSKALAIVGGGHCSGPKVFRNPGTN